MNTSSIYCPPCGKESKFKIIQSLHSEAFNKEFDILECVSCHTRRSSPFLSDDEITAYYQDEEITGAGRYKKWKNKYKYIHDWINKRVSIKGMMVAEIGSNSGNLLRFFKEKSGCNVLGVEFSEQCKVYSEEVNSVPVISDMKSDDTFRSKDLDLLLMVHTFEHIPDPDAFLDEISAYIKKDGHLYIEIPNARMKDYELLHEYENPLCIPFHTYLYNMDSVTSLLQRHGFEVVAQRFWSKKEDGGSITAAYARYLRHVLQKKLGDNLFTTLVVAVLKPIIRFYPLRFVVGYIMSRLNKSSSIAVLCKKTH